MDTPKRSSRMLWLIVGGLFVAVMSLACVGVLAAVAIPAFVGYLARAKSAEAEANLRVLEELAVAYYAEERFVPGADRALTGCVVDSAITSGVPGAEKRRIVNVPESFVALGLGFEDPVYFQYQIVSAGGCDHGPGEVLYTFRAIGDLDADGVQSIREVTASSTSGNTLEGGGYVTVTNANE